MKYLLCYIIVINIAAFFTAYSDKRRAVKHIRRVPESTLFALAFWGGGIGLYLSILIFRHKTRKLKFMLGIPVITAAEYGLILWRILTYNT